MNKFLEKIKKVFSKNFQVLVYHHILTKEQMEIRKQNNDTLALKYFMNTELETFKKQILSYKKANYIFLTIEEVFEKVQNNTIGNDKYVALTFDDGYKDLYQNVYPFLKEENIKASVFINTSTIGLEDFLTKDMLVKIDNQIKVYSHGTTHINFKEEYENKTKTNLELINEVKEPIDYINNLIGNENNRPYIFCYPYGDYNQDFDNILEKEGILRVYTNSLVNNLYNINTSKQSKNVLNREYPFSLNYYKIILKKIYRNIRYS